MKLMFASLTISRDSACNYLVNKITKLGYPVFKQTKSDSCLDTVPSGSHNWTPEHIESWMILMQFWCLFPVAPFTDMV